MQWTLVGHEQEKLHVEHLLESGSLSHAYLLRGPSGIGKRMFAMDLARAILSSPLEPEQNPDCVLLAPGISKETGKPTDIAVEDVRDMKAWAYQRPLYGDAKVVVITDADHLGDAAANTLLKVLEEPPSYLYFFLVTAAAGQLLDTIVSRCQAIDFKPISDSDMSLVLTGLKLDADDRALLRAVAAGRPGVALAMVNERTLPDVARAITLLERAMKAGSAERLVAAKTVFDDECASDIVAWWLAWTHAQLEKRPQLAPLAHGLLELSEAMSESKYNRRLALERFFLQLP